MATPLPEENKSNTLTITEAMKSILMGTSKWAKFLSIMGFIFTGLIGIFALLFIFAGGAITSKLQGMGAMAGGFFSGFIGFIYLLMGLLYYFPSKYLYDFATYAKQAVEINDEESIAYSFQRLKSFFKFWGILMIIVLSIYGVIILFAIIAGVIATIIK